MSRPRLLELVEKERDVHESELSDLEKEEIRQARTELVAAISSFAETSENEVAEPYNGLAEPDDKCRNLLDTWMAKCVFG